MQNTSHSLWELNEIQPAVELCLSPVSVKSCAFSHVTGVISIFWEPTGLVPIKLRMFVCCWLCPCCPCPSLTLEVGIGTAGTHCSSWHHRRPLRAWSAPGWEYFHSLKREEGGPAPRRDTREPWSSARQTHLPYRACPLHHTHTMPPHGNNQPSGVLHESRVKSSFV